ncbi:MAG: Nucleolar protein 58 [Alectoria fallacina]|uniref:Nucleolar protein 58 n=1 Tax=Alectoria fallacina TaxID=1903189 RepID=A0A8H3F1T4_9LECA|nr:MAG: Nucleolar protein 58 [Alectoria fallacina]
MGLFILQETPVGYALLKAKSSKILKQDGFAAGDETAEGICSLLKLKDFHKFDSAATALEQTAALVEGKVTPRLSGLLDSIKDEKKVSLAVADPKLATAINKLPQLSLNLISDSSTQDLYRAIRNHLPSLIPGLLPQDISTMSLGLSHSLSRHKLKFSPDKVDTMIVQAIALLDDLDKELNTYAMRVKEWYGWHFPEMGRIVNDNLAYARVILSMGMRTSAAKADLAEILPEEIETAVKAAAEVSMGTEVTTEDLENIQALAEQVVSFTEYRQQLSGYLSARMAAIAPNLTALVGDLVGARLIAHAGSLMNLAKSPASTIQILGAEKALFRALKTKHDTPKYGLIYHASLIGQASGKNKGKIARMLATKAALGLRVDALADWSAEGEGKGDLVTEEEKSALGIDNRLKIERRLASLEGKPLRSKGVAIAPNGVSFTPGKWEVKEARKYNPDADGLAGDEPAAAEPVSKKSEKDKPKLIEEVAEEPASKKSKRDKKESNHIKPIEEIVEDAMQEDQESSDEEEQERPDEEMEVTPEAPMAPATTKPEAAIETTTTTAKTNGVVEHEANRDDKSETISTVSADTPDSPPSPTQQEVNWQSSILGNTKIAKRARKKERHARKLALSEDRSKSKKLRNEKLARRLDRKERRQKRAEQIEQREERDDAKFGALAKEAGLTISRYKRKLERGEIKFEADGKPLVISKKEIKKARKAAEKAERAPKGDGDSSKKRKRDDEDAEAGAVEKREKKKKKHHKVEA